MTASRAASHFSIFARTIPAARSCQARWLHGNRPPPTIPPPIPLVPDVQAFLTVIGRGMKQHVDKFPSWEALFSLTSSQLKELGIDPPRDRRYLLQWLHRFRQGRYGPGGDFKHIQDGEATLKVAEKLDSAYGTKYVVNLPLGQSPEDAGEDLRDLQVEGYTIRGARAISGPFALPASGGDGAVVKITEGMWEHKRGRKIDGGERRRAEVRFKRRVAQRKTEREAEYQ